MYLSQDQSSSLKVEFKRHFRDNGIDSDLPSKLARMRDECPCEWTEACEEFENYGWPVDA